MSKSASKVVATTRSPQIFDLWANLLLRSAEHCNGSRFGKKFEVVKYLEQTDFLVRCFSSLPGALEKLLATATSLSDDGVTPKSFFEACEYAHARLDSPEFTRWLNDSLQLCKNPAAGMRAVLEYTSSVRLEDVMYILYPYACAFAGRELILEPMKGHHQNLLNLPHTDGTTIWLPSKMSGYGLCKDNLQAYKLFTACQAAKFEFGTFSLENADVQSFVGQLELRYGTKAQGNKPLQRFFSAFPSPELAHTLFELIEGKRILPMLKEGYKGLGVGLDAVVKRQFEIRPLPDGKAGDGLILLEAFAHYLALGNAPPATPARLTQSLRLLYNLALRAITPDAGVISSLKATVACYELFKPFKSEFSNKEAPQKSRERRTTQASAGEFKGIAAQPKAMEKHLMFLDFALGLGLHDFIGEGRGHFYYPEWDVHSGKYNSELCQVAELNLTPVANVPQIPISKAIRSRLFAEGFEQRYESPGHLERRRHEPEGEDINLDAATDFFITSKVTGISRDPNFYIQRRKRPQGITAAFLIDASPSTSFRLHSGKTVIDAERESLELLVAGLAQAKHTFGIFGFTGYQSDSVRVYVIKHFGDTFDRGRLYALDPVDIDEPTVYEPQHDLETPRDWREAMEFSQRSIIGEGTYAGPAIRHVTYLLTTLPSPKKVLFVLTDSEPTGRSSSGETYGGQYACADINRAFAEARGKGVRPFAISFGGGRGSLHEMYGPDFAVIGDPAELVQKLPGIYVEITR